MAPYGLKTFLFGRMGEDEASNLGFYLGINSLFSFRVVALIFNVVDVEGDTAKILGIGYILFLLGVNVWAHYIHNKWKDDFISEYEQKETLQKFLIVAGVFGTLLLCMVSFFTPIFGDGN